MAPSALLCDNALNLNALNLNALNLNALNLDALNLHALDFDALDADALAAIEAPGPDGDRSRQLLQYAVSCALDGTQSFSFSWTDSQGTVHDETYPGLLGLATTWANWPLAGNGQEWVSACLISRVNYFGVHVTLSSRAATAGLVISPTTELDTYTEQEGAFWGNVFASPPTAYACDYTPNDDYSRSRDRVCAAGYVDASGDVQSCGMITRLGSCDTFCTPLTGSRSQFHPVCSTAPIGRGGPMTSRVVTIFLQ